MPESITSTDNLISPKTTSKARSPSPTPDGKKRTSLLGKFNRAPEEPGKEKWRDASLSDKERWKEWQKAKDKEQHGGSTSGYLTTFYKTKGRAAWWIGMLGGDA